MVVGTAVVGIAVVGIAVVGIAVVGIAVVVSTTNNNVLIIMLKTMTMLSLMCTFVLLVLYRGLDTVDVTLTMTEACLTFGIIY